MWEDILASLPEDQPWSRQVSHMRRGFLADQLETISKDQKSGSPQYSLLYRLLEELTADAVAKVAETDPYRVGAIEDRLYQASDLAEDLMYAASYDEKKTFAEQSPLKQNPNFWRHAVHPGYEIKNRSYRVLGKSDVEGAAERYLSQDLRSQLFDRTLVIGDQPIPFPAGA